MGFFNGVIKALGFDPNDRAVAKYDKKTEIIDSYEAEVEKLSDEELALLFRLLEPIAADHAVADAEADVGRQVRTIGEELHIHVLLFRPLSDICAHHGQAGHDCLF